MENEGSVVKWHFPNGNQHFEGFLINGSKFYYPGNIINKGLYQHWNKDTTREYFNISQNGNDHGIKIGFEYEK